MSDVFISYRQDERAAISVIADGLRALGVSVWFDEQLRPDGSFDEKIAAELNAAPAVLVCWTPAAMESKWVRGEAALALEAGKYVSCFLAPTKLIPPFNLDHTENLSAWAGQEDDPAWVRLLQVIGDKLGRPGLHSYARTMRPEATVQELRSWAEANGADPLVDNVWKRLALVEDETGSARLAREKDEARKRAEVRGAQEKRSRQLSAERGMRDPKAARTRLRILTVAVGLIVVLAAVGGVYLWDAQRRETELARLSAPADIAVFIKANSWHPVAAVAKAKIAAADNSAWSAARAAGSIADIETYLKSAAAYQSAHLAEAQQALESAHNVQRAQQGLARLSLYRGADTGAYDATTKEAVETFQFNNNITPSSPLDADFFARLDGALSKLSQVKPDDLHGTPGPPSMATYRSVAARLKVDAATLTAIRTVEAATRAGFADDGRPLILFGPYNFSQLTQGRYDKTHPHLSAPAQGHGRIPETQEGRWAQLREAYALAPEEAFGATAFGVFGIMGKDYQLTGFKSPSELANFLSQSEDNQLEAFARYVESANLVTALQAYDWEAFAFTFNGPDYVPSYSRRVAAAYKAAAKQMGAPIPQKAERAPPGPTDPIIIDRAEMGLPSNPVWPWVILVLALAAAAVLYSRRAPR